MKISLFPLDIVLFPGAALPLHIFEDRYKEMVGECLENEAEFGVVRARAEGLAVIGCTAAIVAVLNRYEDGRLDVLCEGRHRFEIKLLDDTRSFYQADVDPYEDDGPESTRSMREQCAALHFEMLDLTGSEPAEFPSLDLDHPVSFQLASTLPADLDFKQSILGLRSDRERTKHMLHFYEQVIPKLRRSSTVSQRAATNGHIM